MRVRDFALRWLRNISLSRVHHGFPDVVRWRDEFWAACRVGTEHASYDGMVAVLRSKDFAEWKLVAVFADAAKPDIRDPKFLATQERLFIYMPTWLHPSPDDLRFGYENRATHLSSTADGLVWEPLKLAYEPGWCFWRPATFGGMHYVAAYLTGSYREPDHTSRAYRDSRRVDLLSSPDGQVWSRVSTICHENAPGETAIGFEADGTIVALIRREYRPSPEEQLPNLVSIAQPPYGDWESREASLILQGPAMTRYQGAWLVGGRAFRRKQGDLFPQPFPEMGLGILDPQTGIIQTISPLPSFGDCSYPGFVELEKGELGIVYYSTHEGPPSQLYAARVRLALEA